MIHRPTPTAQTWRASALALILALLVGPLLALGQATAAAAQTERCFPETTFCVRGRFLDRWTNFGGLAINGYPITAERTETLEDGKPYTVQWFERVRMELHPENPPPNDVLLGQFGRILHPADPPVPAQPGLAYFPQTGHNIPPDFAAYYAANGGLSQFGYPLSEVIREQLEDGRTYEVQYTERARFERHPEVADPQYRVLLGQFGRRILAMRTAPPPPPAGNVILQDDFANPASGWQQVGDAGGSVAYADGGLRFTITQPDGTAVGANPKLVNLGDTQVEVDATKVSGPEDSGFGIICRFGQPANFYLFLVTNDGNWGILKAKDGNASVLAVGRAPTVIKSGTATNRLRADCVGRTLALHVNGQKLGEVQDPDIGNGVLALFAHASDAGAATYLFDNFVARRP